MEKNYVHENYFLKQVKGEEIYYKKNYRGHKKGDLKDPEMYKLYNDFYCNHYLKIRSKIENLATELENKDEYFNICAEEFSKYWNELLKFMKNNKISSNSKIHTNFLEEFSIYFLSSIPGIENYDIFTHDVFAGFKLTNDYKLEQINKDVDFCIGKVINNITILNQRTLTIKIPIISVEIKSYVDATMLGEVTNTARKIKNAVPNSKSVLLSFLKAFKNEHIYEVSSEGYIDEIIMMTNNKRLANENTMSGITFTKKGLKDYYTIIEKFISEVKKENNIGQIGAILTTIDEYKNGE